MSKLLIPRATRRKLYPAPGHEPFILQDSQWVSLKHFLLYTWVYSKMILSL